MKTAVVYARVSTTGQAEDGTSLDTQEAACRKWAEHNGCTVLEAIRDEVTGATMRRPGLDRVRDLVAAKDVAAVIVYSLDRLSRDTVDTLVLQAEFKKYGVDLVGPNMPSEDTPMGKMHLTMLAAMNEFERSQIKERTRRGTRARVSEGKAFVGRCVPFGYTYCNGVLTVDEPEAAWVLRIFEWAAEGMTPGRIAAELNTLGVKSKRGATHWRKATIRLMLQSATYRGEFLYGKREAVEPKKPRSDKRIKPNSSYALRDASEYLSVSVPAIVSSELWQRVQRDLTEVKSPSPKQSYPYLFSGRMRCAQCGRRYDGTGGKHPYYRCAGRGRDVVGSGEPCRNANHNARDLDFELWQRIEDALSDADTIMTLFGSDVSEREVERMRIDSDALDRKLAEHTLRADRLLDLYEGGDIDKDTYRERRAKLEAERAAVAQARDELARKLESAQASHMTREQAEELAQFAWLLPLLVCDEARATGPVPVRFIIDFRRRVVASMQAQVIIDGKRKLLRGTISSHVLDVLRSFEVEICETQSIEPSDGSEQYPKLCETSETFNVSEVAKQPPATEKSSHTIVTTDYTLHSSSTPTATTCSRSTCAW